MRYFKNIWKTYSLYFTDLWQYLIIPAIFILVGKVYLKYLQIAKVVAKMQV